MDDTTDAPRGASLRRRAVLSGSVAALAGLGGCTGRVRPFVGKRETDEARATGARSVLVAADVGDVTVAPNADLSAGTVRARATKRSASVLSSLSAVRFSATTADGRAEVRVRNRDDDDAIKLGPTPDVTLRVEVHPSVAVEAARSESGDVTVENLDGPGGDGGGGDALAVESVNGDVTARGTNGDARVRSNNGDATAEDVRGFVRVHTTNGDARATACDGVLGVTSRNGDVAADVAALRSDAAVATTNGDASARLGDGLDARVVGETTHGDLTVSAELSDSERSDSRVSGVVGDGGPTLRVRSENGDVTIE